MKPLAACLFVLSLAALALAGCGGSGGSSSSTAGSPGGGERPAEAGGPVKKATAPRAPAGSKVIACADGPSELRAGGADCDTAKRAMRRWRGSPGCGLRPDASRTSCSLGPYRCQAISVDRGVAVSCVRKGGIDVSFLARPRR